LTGRDFKELIQLHDTYASKGFQILMFPSNSFKQEPLLSEKIEKTYRGKLGAKWWISELIEVNGTSMHPLYQYLRYNSKLNANMGSGKTESCKQIPWNYTKFLVDG